MKVLEREAFLRDLKACMREAAQGSGGLIFISGEAGVGKTVLLRIFAQAVEGIARVAVGLCDPLATPRPLGPVFDVVGLAPNTVGRLAAGAERGDVFEMFLAEIGSAPTLLVFEDAQWADEATFDLLQYLGRRLHQTHALLVVTFRNDEVDRGHPLTAVLGDLATTLGVRRMTLPPLSPAAVRTLAAGSNLDPDELHRRTGGNPFFVTEVLAARSPGIPVTARDAVLARASRLSSRARQVLDAAAVIGVRLEPWLVAAVAGVSRPEAEALDECVAAGMLRRWGAMLTFRHELAREAILDGIPPQQKAALHRAVLDVLRSSPATQDDFSRLVHHAESAGDAEAVVAYGQEAARRAAALGAHREAAAYYERAARFAGGLPPAHRAALLERRAYELFLTGQYPDAVETHEQALEYRRASGDPRATGDSLRALSRILWCTGRIDDAGRRAQEALMILEQLPPGRELAMAYSAMSSVCMNAEDAGGTRRWGTPALELARQHDDVETLAQTLNNLGTSDLLRGVPEGRDRLEESLAIAQRAGLVEHVGRAFVHLAWAATRSRRLDMADRVMDGLAYTSERDLFLWRLWLNAYLSRLLFDQGRWREAEIQAAPVVHSRTASLSKIPALCVLALTRARRGEAGGASLLNTAWALAGPTHQLQHLAPVAAARAEAAWLSGDGAAIDGMTREAFDRAAQANDPWTLGELAYWRRRGGIESEAPNAAAEPYALMMAGDWARAAEAWRTLGCPYETALALAEGAAEDPLRQALGIFEQLGARPLAAMAARRLREMGVRGIPRGPRASTRVHPAGLTAREMEVVPLLVQGLSNSEIARRIYVSPKTVDHHISSILSKLGVRRRVDAAREAIRLGLVPEPVHAAPPDDMP